MNIYETIDEWSVKYKQPARQFKNYPEFKLECLNFLEEQYNIKSNKRKIIDEKSNTFYSCYESNLPYYGICKL